MAGHGLPAGSVAAGGGPDARTVPGGGDAGAGGRAGGGLDSIHRAGVVHRDLKPSNVLLSGEGPRIIDFGIARAADDHALTRPGGVLGTPGYMAPEQAAGREVRPAGDVFALGAVLGFTVLGRRVFGDGPLPVMIHRVLHEDPDLDGIPDTFLRGLVADCLTRNPALRPTSAMLLDRLSWAARHRWASDGCPRRWPGGSDQAGAAAAATMPLPRRVRRRRLLVAGGIAAVGAAGAGLGELTAWRRSGTGTSPRTPETPAAAGGGPTGDGRRADGCGGGCGIRGRRPHPSSMRGRRTR